MYEEVLWDDLKGYGGGGEEWIQEGADICTPMAYSRCTAKTITILLKKKKLTAGALGLNTASKLSQT